MSVCPNCGVRQERGCNFIHETREYYKALIQALRYVAYRRGYALAVHGSLKTDIDLIAVPWRESAVDAESLAEAIRVTADNIIGVARVREVDKLSNNSPNHKPCGRLAWSFYLSYRDEGPYIDLSVIPPPPRVRPKKRK